MTTKDRRSLEGTIWLVTGASSGIGREFAFQLARRKAGLWLHGRQPAALETSAQECRRLGAFRVDSILGDLSRQADLGQVIRTVLESGRPLHGLINNAGLGFDGPVISRSTEQISTQIQVNIGAVAGLTRHLLPELSRHPAAWILNVSSIAGFQAVPTQAVYAATKAWVYSFSAALHEEVKPLGIFVTALCPGLTHTDFFRRAGINLRRRYARWGSWCDPSAVAAAGLEGVVRGHRIVIPGLMNKFLPFLQNFLPRSAVHSITRWVMS